MVACTPQGLLLTAVAAFRSAMACHGQPGGGYATGFAPSSPALTGRELERSEMNPIPLVDESRLVDLINTPSILQRRWDERAACAEMPGGFETYFPEDGAP